MKVYIGPPINYIGPYQIADMIFFWVEQYPDDESLHSRWDYRLHDRFGIWLANTWVRNFCQWIEGKRKRNTKIRIDRHDTWSMDYTLAHIVLPMLKQLKETKHGSPYVDNEDLPEHLRMSKREMKVLDEGGWNKKLKATEEEQKAVEAKFHSRWSWILDEMIFAFESHFNEWEDQFISGDTDWKCTPVDAAGDEVPKSEAKLFRMDRGPAHTYEIDMEGHNAYGKRIQDGYKLFGKYYQNLWD